MLEWKLHVHVSSNNNYYHAPIISVLAYTLHSEHQCCLPRLAKPSLVPRPRPAFRLNFCPRVGEPGNEAKLSLLRSKFDLLFFLEIPPDLSHYSYKPTLLFSSSIL